MDTDNPAIYLASAPEKNLYFIIMLNQERSVQRLISLIGKAKSIALFSFFFRQKKINSMIFFSQGF